ncbi:thiamine-phosphate kinase [Pseudoroseomonas globiformis]|uniref:Thiamine-monophosphate kinase n=1 Tax=Teichococcus globiformis TaxID=2307229 RepID=A0ABV7FWL0_9PROT
MNYPSEFSLIDRCFRPLAGDGALDLADDAAVLTPPQGRELVIAADALVETVHFLPDDPAGSVGRKLLRTNLSDLAAMGAVPLGYLMTVAVPKERGEAWLQDFAEGLAADQREFGLSLLGGDTVSTPGPISLSLTVLGHVAPSAALRRSGGRPGHDLWVSGTVGDGILGLRARRGAIGDEDGYLTSRYRLPQPRLMLGQSLVGFAACAMDVSDGLVQDLGHICRASGCGAEIFSGSIPLSLPAKEWLRTKPGGLIELLAGGDDYELLFSAPAEAAVEIQHRAKACDTLVTRIGRLVSGEMRVSLVDIFGNPMPVQAGGWSHF